MIRRTALAAAIALAPAVPATAADWNGFYVGKLGFYNHTEFAFYDEECAEQIGEIEAFFCLIMGDGLDEVGLAKVFGYNWQHGDLVIGIDGLIAWQSMNEIESDYLAVCEIILTDCSQVDFDVSKLSVQAMGRFGIVATDNVMIYGAAGVGASRWLCTGDCEPSVDWYPYGAIAAGVEVAANDSFVWRTHVQFSRSLNLDDPVSAWAVATGGVWNIN